MRSIKWMLVWTFVSLSALGWIAAPSASALSPWWHVTSNMRPEVLHEEGTIVSQALNVGDRPAGGSITLTETLPAGVTVAKIEVAPGELEPEVTFDVLAASPGLGAHEERRFNLGEPGFGPGQEHGFEHACTEPKAREVRCVYDAESFASVAPYEFLEMGVAVKAEEGAASGSARVEVSGGEAPSVHMERELPVGDAAPSFGVEESSFSSALEEEGGRADVQAGSHPFQLTTSLAFNQGADPLKPPALARDLQFTLPAGLVGNASAIAQCSDADFRHLQGGIVDICPNDTAVGVATLTIDEPIFGGVQTISIPVFNLAPERGEPARFGFEYVGTPVTIDPSVRTGRDYGVTASISNITELANVIASTVTFWGVPGASSHDESRGWGCLANEHWASQAGLSCTPIAESQPKPFLTLPSSCSTSFTTTVKGSSWPLKVNGAPEPVSIPLPETSYSLQDEFGRVLGVTGCDELSFSPSIAVAPEARDASTPSGLTVDVRVPQEASEGALGLSSSDVKGVTVALPEGVTVNAAAAGGLQACSESQIGFEGQESSTGTDLFTAGLPSPFCPEASKVATVRIKSPLLPAGQFVEGAVYVAAQTENPFGSLIAMYIVAEDPISGILVKLPLDVSLNGETGQLTSTLQDSPQLPFEEAEFHFFGGPRAPLATPAHCGTDTTNASFAPWSGNPTVDSSSSFQITAGPNGTSCPSTLPFAPTFASGTASFDAGAFSPLTASLSREDGEQQIQTLQLHYPPGVSGFLTGVALCPEAQANAGTCGAESRIGHTSASIGVGNEPYTVTGGEMFLTEGYEGAPFGLSIVTPAVAGPYNLGNVVVRAKLQIDPFTAAVTVTTGSIPHILDGIPLQIRNISATIDRAGFSFNPTNCKPMAITGTVGSVEGATSPVSEPFEVANCATLKFAPKFEVSTSAKTSKADGASLTTKIFYPPTPPGSQATDYASIASAKVDLPKQLPSRLTTLQKACLASVFEANPADCPAASIVGHARVITPLLPVPLTGPAYFVSHGGEAFPSLTMVLQGYGVTIDLVGSTLIKKGITSTTFKSTPDAPLTMFELTLPEGKDSALAANGNLCKAKLDMPNVFNAQNGLSLRETTKITVTNCPKASKAKHAAKKSRK
ncbi:MAG TPA: hypothetical protein VN892_11270 [Solirubrobacteraceae bacterium]|nr:hypothetical protein [Solirubrobacteraceae bacterium]